MGHAWRLCRRHPAVATLLVTLAMTLATGVVGLFVLLNQAAAERARLAEARRHADAYEQFSASAADQLGEFLRTTIRYQGKATPDQMTTALLKLRSSTNALKGRGIVPSSTLGILEEEIGWALSVANKIDEARDLLKQAVSDLKQSSAKKPEDKETRFYLVEALVLSGYLAESAGQLDDALSCFEQAAAIHMACEPSDSKYAILTALYMRLRGLADRLGQLGRTGHEERSRRLSQQILQHLIGSDNEQLTNVSPPGLQTLGRLFQHVDLKKMSSDEIGQVSHAQEGFVANWLALSVGPLSPFRSSSSAATYDRDPEAGAVALISAIRDRCSKLGLADSMVLAAISVVWNDAAEVAVEQRKLGRLDDARATAARLMALARRLVREYPDSALSYRVLSEAHNQVKKNAFQTGDDNLVEEALDQAVKAAQRSLALDPDRLETRRHLDKLTEQLASIKSDRHAPGSSPP
jgi:tetratricopeptide (TPR) repeat protein